MKYIATLIAGILLISNAFSVFAKENQSISANEFLSLTKIDNPASKKDSSGVLLLDVRTVNEYNNGHIPGAINIPVAELPDALAKLSDKSQQIVVYCRSGKRAGRAISFLDKQGFQNLVHLEGDYSAWEAQGLPIEKP